MALREKDIATGLHTTGFLVALGARELARFQKSGAPLSLVTIRTGDPATCESRFSHRDLMDIACKIRNETGSESVMASLRVGEITVLLPSTPKEEAARIAGRIGRAISRRSECSESQKAAVLSIGVASSSPNLAEFDDLVRASREAVIEAG